MAIFINDQHIAHLSTNPSYYEYVTLTGEVNRNGNTVTLSNLSVSVRVGTAYSVYGESQTYYIADSASSTTQLSTTGNFVFNFSDGPNHTESHSMGDMSISVGVSDTSKTLYLRAVGNEDSPLAFTITFPAGSTDPSGLSFGGISQTSNTITVEVKLTDWGSEGDATNRRLGVACKSPDSSSVPMVWAEYGDEPSRTFTLSGRIGYVFSIKPNTRYGLRARAEVAGNYYNYPSASTYQYITTLPSLSSISVETTGVNFVTIAYSTPAGGGHYAQNIEYSLDNGTTWTTGATIPSGTTTAQSDTFTISNLTPGNTYTVLTRISTDAGSTLGTTLTVTIPTLPKNKLYGSTNSAANLVLDFYGSVNSQAQKVTKKYGSVNGRAKLTYQGFGHLTYI